MSGGFFYLENAMTKKEKEQYQPVSELQELLMKTLSGKKHKLDCGHHVSWAKSDLANNVFIINDRNSLRIVCSDCGR